MLARWFSDICEPIQSHITGLPNHSINPPSTITVTRPACGQLPSHRHACRS